MTKTNEFLFVGERPSPTALSRGWGWKDGRLAAAQLFRALLAMNLDPAKQRFENVFVRSSDRVNSHAIKRIRESPIQVVAMGQKASKVLLRYEIYHLWIPHPAARGKIRLKENYCRWVANVLQFGMDNYRSPAEMRAEVNRLRRIS